MRIIVAGHRQIYGALEALVDYLNAKCVNKLTVIYHPLFTSVADQKTSTSEIREYRNGLCIYRKRFTSISHKFTGYMQHLIISIMIAIFSYIKTKSNSDLYIGVNTLNALVGVLLKKLKIVNNTVFLSEMFHYKYSNNPFVNGLYLFAEKLCSTKSDAVWSHSSKLMRLRQQVFGVKGKNLLVPNGVTIRKLALKCRRERENEDEPRVVLVFTGHLSRRSGIQLVIDVFPELLKEFPQVKVLIIGDGPLTPKLKDFVTKKVLKKQVDFLGIVEHENVLEILQCCDVGLAPYNPFMYTEEWAADPLKIKEYLACGLPVIVTKAHWTEDIAMEIERFNAGFAIKYDEHAFLEAVRKLLSDSISLRDSKENAKRLAAKHDYWSWDKIFDNAFHETLQLVH